MDKKKTLLGVFVMLMGLGLSSFVSIDNDDRKFRISKNLDIFNTIFKELDLFYVDTINPDKMIQNGVEAFDCNEYLAQFLGLFVYGAINFLANRHITFR